MTVVPHIDPMPTPPSIDDNRYEFDAHAFATVAAQANLVMQLNAFGAWFNESLGSYTVLDDPEEEYELTSDDMGKIYRRTTNAGAKTLIISPESEHPLQDGGAWLFRNSGAGALTVDAGIGVTVNTPPGSSLIVSADVTFMLIRVAVDEFDLIILSEGIVIDPVFGDIDVEGTVTAGESVTAPEFNAYGNSPIFRFKDLSIAGANIDGAIFFYDSTDTIIGKAGYFNANGSYEIYNPGRDIKLNSASVAVAGNLDSYHSKSRLHTINSSNPIQFFIDTDTSGANIRGFTSYQDSTFTNICTVGFFDDDSSGDGSYEIKNPGRKIKLTGSTVVVSGAFSCGGAATFSSTVSAVSFSGSGAGLNSIPASGVSGTAMTLSGAQTATGAKTFNSISVDVTSGASYVDFKSAGTQFGRLSFGTDSELAIINGAGSPYISFTASSYTIFNATTMLGNLTMANNDVSSVKNLQVNTNITAGGTIVSSTGVSQLAKLGVATSSLGSDVLAVNGTTTFYGSTVTNGNTSATGSVTGGSVVSNGDISCAGIQANAKIFFRYNAGSSPTYTSGQVEINNAASGNPVVMGFHAQGVSAAAIVHLNGGSGLEVNGTAFGVLAAFKASQYTASSGIVLGNSAQSGTNVLDYYEEQISFTVVVYGGTSPGSCTYTTRTGKATRTGNDCSGQIVVGWTGHTGTGDLYISGLPFTNFSINAAISIFVDGLVGPAGSTSFQGFGVGGGANISISTIAATTGVKSNVQLGSNANVTNVTINFKYQIL